MTEVKLKEDTYSFMGLPVDIREWEDLPDYILEDLNAHYHNPHTLSIITLPKLVYQQLIAYVKRTVDQTVKDV